MGRDWRQYPPVILAVGPVLHLDDAVGNEVVAMIGRGLPRDYLDVAASLRRYDRGQLLELNARGRRRPGSADVLGGDGQVLPGQSHRPLVNRGVHLRGAVAQDAGHAVRVGIGLAQQARALVYRPGRVNNLIGRGRVPPCSGEAS